MLPGILLSLGVLWLFLATPLRFFLYGTVWGIALALILADSPVTTQAFKAGLLQLGADLEEAARVSGASWALHLPAHPVAVVGAHRRRRGVDEFRQRLDQHQYPCATLQPRIPAAWRFCLLEYSFTGELERAAALGLLITVIIGVMMLVGRKLGLQLSARIRRARNSDEEACSLRWFILWPAVGERLGVGAN